MTTILDDYTARSAQELTVSKGQHVRILQRQLSNAPDWCLIRLLNDQHHHHSQASNSIDSSSSGKHIEGLVPASILKGNKSSSTNLSSHPPLPPLTVSSKSEQGEIIEFNSFDKEISRRFSQKFYPHKTTNLKVDNHHQLFNLVKEKRVFGKK